MKHRIAVGAGLTVLGIAAASSAHAQIYVGPPRIYAAPPVIVDPAVVPPGEILMLVRAAGLTPLTQPARRGPRYVLLASDRMGGQLQVVLSAYDGRIIRVVPAHDPRFAYHPPRPHGVVPLPPAQYGAPPPSQYGAPPPAQYGAPPAPRYGAPAHELKDPPPPVRSTRSTPPRGSGPPPRTDDQRLASAPPAADPVPPRPARTPLPRPRPLTASNRATPPVETSPEAETPTPPAATAAQPRPAPTTGQGKPAAAPPAETKLVPVAPLE